MKRLLLSACLLLLCAESCARISSKAHSVTDLNYRDRKFSRILVIGNFEKLDQIKEMEYATVFELQLLGVHAAANSELLPPIREYSEDEKKKAYISGGFDAYLQLSEVGVNTVMYHVPIVSMTTGITHVHGTTPLHKNTHAHTGSAVEIGSERTITSGGYSQEAIGSIDFKGELYDIVNGNLAWRCEASTSMLRSKHGNTWSADEDIVYSVCLDLVREMERSEIVHAEDE